MEYKDYYKILGIDRGASSDEIQKAYRKLARKCHPDINHEAGAETRFKEIGEAYEVLKDENKRAHYDRFGSAYKNVRSGGAPPPGFEGFDFDFGGQDVRFDFGGGSGFSSFFDMLFGGGGPGGPQFHGGRSPRPRASMRGSDQEARIEMSLEEAAAGGQRQIVLGEPGGGRKTLRVNIPAGVRDGGRIRLAGQGSPGPTGERGDLFLRIDIQPHTCFRLDGLDLHTTLDITPWEAALGSPVKVPTLDGKVAVKIPAGSSTGRRIRLRGRGYPSAGEHAGDLYAELRIVLPKKLSDRERELFESLRDESSFDPRPD